MTILYYRNNDGRYVGAFDTPQSGLIECDPPADARQVWDDVRGAWGSIPEAYKPLDPASLLMGLLHLNITPDMVDAAIATMPEPDRTIAKWRWERSNTFERDDWLIEEMTTAFGKTSEEVDDAWLYAISGAVSQYPGNAVAVEEFGS